MSNHNEERLKQANVYSKKGNYQQLGAVLCQNGNPLNFIISGRISQAQFDTLEQLVDTIIGKFPLIVLHNNHPILEQKVANVYERKIQSGTLLGDCPLWNIGKDNLVFEPLYGMDEVQIVKVLKRLAIKMDYTVTPRFERIVRAHLRILKEQNVPASLARLQYLCGFEDMQEFQKNIMALPCGPDVARRIWADMGLDNDKNAEQFDLFRNVITNFVYEMKQSGWKPDAEVMRVNALTAIKRCATLVFSVNDVFSDFFFNYLVDELRGNEGKPFFVLLDNVRLDDSYFSEFLIHPSANCRVGVVAENAASLMGRDTENFFRFAEKVHCYILFKHKTSAAASIYSEIIGKFDYTKTEYSEGTQRESFKIIASGHHSDTRYSVENQYRIMPEDIMQLGNGQAYVFDTLTDMVYRYN